MPTRLTLALLLSLPALAALALPGPALAAGTCTIGLLVYPVTVTGAGAIPGTPGNDVILGSSGRDTITGNGGDEHILGDTADATCEGIIGIP